MDQTAIEDKHLTGTPKKIGRLGEKDLFQLKTKGGFCMLVTKKERGFEVISAGPHHAVARAQAMKTHKNIDFTELSKADHVPEEHYAHLMPEAAELTAHLRKLNGDQ